MSRLHDVYAKQTKRPLEVLSTSARPGLPASQEESYFELPRLLMDLSPELLDEFSLIQKNLWLVCSAPIKALMLCGLDHGDDASRVALSLAAYITRKQEKETLLVESNVHSPMFHRFHKGKKCPGFCELLDEHRPAEFYAMPSTEPRLSMIHVGGAMRREDKTFAQHALEQVVPELTSRYPFVLFSGPSVETKDCLNLAGCVDGVLFVIRAGELAERVRRGKMLLDKAQAKLVGAILTR